MRKIYNALKVFVTRKLVIEFDKMEFTYTHLSHKRYFNWVLAELSSILKTSRAYAYPTHLQLEPTNNCNLSCPLCNVVTDKNRKKGVLRFDAFQKLIDEIGECLLMIQFWGWGEPFLNKNLFNMIKYAKSKGIKCITSTNGHFFDDSKTVDQLIDAGLDYLILAIDGFDQETYEKYRSGGELNKVLNGLRSLSERKAQLKSALPYLNLRMVVSKANENQIPQLKSLAHELGVDFCSLITMSPINSEEKEWQKRIPTNAEYCRMKINQEGQLIRKKNLCKRLWNHPFVYYDGIVFSCEYFTSENTPHGNIFEKGFGPVWFGQSFRELRKNYARKSEDAKCTQCPRNFADADKNVSHVFRMKDEEIVGKQPAENTIPFA